MKPADPKFDPNATTVAQAQKFLQDKAASGAICPCCRQVVKLLEKEFTVSMAYVLILLHRQFDKTPDWLQVPEYLSEMVKLGSAVKGTDFSRLRYWGLLEEQPHPTKKGQAKAGFYKMTPKGHQLAKGEIKVPKAVFMYNGQPRGFPPGDASIQELLGKEYDYQELLSGKFGTFIV